MPSILDSILSSAKILGVGENGTGKSGSTAALIAAGYHVRIIDTDKGAKILRSLITDERYPYAKYIRSRNIDIADHTSIIPIDIEMIMRPVQIRKGANSFSNETVLAPKNSNAWMHAMSQLQNWNDGERRYGNVDTWGEDTVLVIDTCSTLAKMAFYWNQGLQGHLGAIESGNEYRRDVGGAQSMITRLLELLSSSALKCNVILFSHITWVDDSRGVAEKPRTTDADGNTVFGESKGYPSAIGRALSPQMGKYFNDVYQFKSSGSGANVKRVITTVTDSGVNAKNSVWLDREYDLTTGLAEIFAALRGQPEPTEFLDAIRGHKMQSTTGSSSASASRPAAPKLATRT